MKHYLIKAFEKATGIIYIPTNLVTKSISRPKIEMKDLLQNPPFKPNKNMNETTLFESTHLNITSPSGTFKVEVRKVRNGSLNIITHFNPIVQPTFHLVLAVHPFVKKISSLQNYEKEMGGISLELSDNFNYEIFVKDLSSLMNNSLR